jgi:hypothetical protein|tara:strand:+ start:15260 stop:15373 length:114 start_codon:yes stop_codon:yes gene_type:complete
MYDWVTTTTVDGTGEFSFIEYIYISTIIYEEPTKKDN